MAGKLIEFQTEEGGVLIAVPTPPGMVQPTGKLEDSIDSVNKSLSAALHAVAGISKSFREAFAATGAKSAELELGLQFTAKGSVYVVETTGQASLKIKLSYSS